jgi:hypothetical protein
LKEELETTIARHRVKRISEFEKLSDLEGHS